MKNQTSQKHIQQVSENKNIKGVGRFVHQRNENEIINNPELSKLKIEVIKDLNYEETLKLGEYSVAFKFLPYMNTYWDKFVESYEDLPEQAWYAGNK